MTTVVRPPSPPPSPPREPDLVRPVVRRSLRGFAELAATTALAHQRDPEWLTSMRRSAVDQVIETGLPDSKDEEWRFTSLHGLASVEFVPNGASQADVGIEAIATAIIDQEWSRVVLVDGRVNRELSQLPQQQGVRCEALAAAIGANLSPGQHLGRVVPVDATPFTAINAALFADGVALHLAANVSLARPLQIIHVATDAAHHAVIAPRVLVTLDRGAAATIIETFVSIASDRTAYLLNGVTELVLDQSSRLEHVRVQREAPAAWHVGYTGVSQQRESHYRSFTLALGGRLSRHNLTARLSGPEGETLLYGLYLGRGEQTVDNHTAIHHDAPNCRSWEVYRGVLAEQSHGVFNGKVLVRPEAQRTDAKQTNRNLLLSDSARVDTKPQLEIFADDVRCTHGATVGRLDEQQRFYLRARGITGAEAQAMLIAAFMAEPLEAITLPEVRAAMQGLLHAAMPAMTR